MCSIGSVLLAQVSELKRPGQKYQIVCMYFFLDCHRALDPSSVNDGPDDGAIFCTNCYQKRYGPTVRVLIDEELHRHGSNGQTTLDPSLKACHRCHKVVYVAEEIVTNDRSYHRSCAKCNQCHRQLDLQTLHDAPDEEIYCNGCYSRQFGSSGYRGTSSNVWTDQTAAAAAKVVGNAIQRQVKEMTPIVIGVTTDNCNRCKGAVS